MNDWCLLLVCVGFAMVRVEGLSQLMKDKIRQHFIVADCNKDGTIQLIDYICIVDNIMAMPGYDKIDKDTFHNVVAVNAWYAFPKQDTTLDQYYAIVEGSPVEEIAFAARNLSGYMFEAWGQLNRPTGMNVTELRNEYSSLGKTQNLDGQAWLAMGAMDDDEDGYVQKKEYQDCAAKYLTVNNPNDDSKYFFGGLLEG